MGAGPDNKPLASPGNFFPGRKPRVGELFAKLLGRSFLPLPHFAAVDHHIMRVALSLDLDLAKFDQSRFHVSTGRCRSQRAGHGCLSACFYLFQRFHDYVRSNLWRMKGHRANGNSKLIRGSWFRTNQYQSVALTSSRSTLDRSRTSLRRFTISHHYDSPTTTA